MSHETIQGFLVISAIVAYIGLMLLAYVKLANWLAGPARPKPHLPTTVKEMHEQERSDANRK